MWLSLEKRCLHILSGDPRCLSLCDVISRQHRTQILKRLVCHNTGFLCTPLLFRSLPLSFFHPSYNKGRLFLDSAEITDEFLYYLAGVCDSSDNHNGSPCSFKEIEFLCGGTVLSYGLAALLQKQSALEKLVIKGLKTKSTESIGLSTLCSNSLTTVSLEMYVRNHDWTEVVPLVLNNPSISSFSLSTRGRSLHDENTLFIALYGTLSHSLINVELINISVEREILSEFLLRCTLLRSIKLTGCIQLDPAAFESLADTAHWECLYVTFQVTPPYDTYVALQSLPASIRRLSLRFGPSNRNMVVPAILRLPLLKELCYQTEFFNDVLIGRLVLENGYQLSALDIGFSDTMTDEGLDTILSACPNLERLLIHSDLNKTNRVVTGFSLLRLAEPDGSGHKLRVLYLNYFRALTADVLEAVLPALVNMEEIYVAGVRAVHSGLLILMAQHMPRLRVIDVQRCWSVTDDGIIAVAENLRHLRHLNVAVCWRLTDASLLALARYCPQLDTFIYQGLRQISDAALDELRSSCTGRLKHVMFSWFA